MSLRQRLRRVVRATGFDLVRYPPSDYDGEFLRLVERVQPYTMTSPERIHALYQATRYVSRAGVPGAVVECGVWRGGGMLVVAQALLDAGDTERDLYLFDTFRGMMPPGAEDLRYDGTSARRVLDRADPNDQASEWCVASLDDVRRTLSLVPYPEDRIHLVEGPVATTLPAAAPGHVALLRLDTDWYESTRHELEHLYPRIPPGGVLLVDDYGYWKGARKAVDEYLSEHDIALLLHRIDDCGRIALVPALPRG
jgi:O-methyltransferase